jgi:large subunit ribosomal protein L4
MATVDIKNVEGKKVGSAALADSVFAIEPNSHVVHQVVRSQMAARRSGTHDTKTRGEVSGGGAKPWRQKGTGRARAGSSRSPLWAGGGTIFGPHPRSYAFRVPNKVVKTADGDLLVIDGFGLDEPSTKKASEALKALGIDGRVTVVVENEDDKAIMSLRNIERARVITASEANTYDLVDNGTLLFTQPALEWLQGVLS